MESFFLRMARRDELQKLIDIDDEASELYIQAGLKFAVEKNHPFAIAESIRWAGAIERGLAHVAVNLEDQPIGFVTLGFADSKPYLDQIAVRPTRIGDEPLLAAYARRSARKEELQ